MGGKKFFHNSQSLSGNLKHEHSDSNSIAGKGGLVCEKKTLNTWEGSCRNKISMYNPSSNLPPLEASPELISWATWLKFEYVAVTKCATLWPDDNPLVAWSGAIHPPIQSQPTDCHKVKAKRVAHVVTATYSNFLQTNPPLPAIEFESDTQKCPCLSEKQGAGRCGTFPYWFFWKASLNVYYVLLGLQKKVWNDLAGWPAGFLSILAGQN